MIIPILNYKNLLVADVIPDIYDRKIKIVSRESSDNLSNNCVFSPFVTDIENDIPMVVSTSNHVKHLNYYVTWFGFPKKIRKYEAEKQKVVVEEVKRLRKLGKI